MLLIKRPLKASLKTVTFLELSGNEGRKESTQPSACLVYIYGFVKGKFDTF